MGKPAETKEHPLSGSGILRTVALYGDYQLDSEDSLGRMLAFANIKWREDILERILLN